MFEFDSKDTVADGLKKAQFRIEEQKTDFESYIPKEIPKFDSAVLFFEENNFLLIDEPTNHLNQNSREVADVNARLKVAGLIMHGGTVIHQKPEWQTCP